jgi:hypothetical protein
MWAFFERTRVGLPTLEHNGTEQRMDFCHESTPGQGAGAYIFQIGSPHLYYIIFSALFDFTPYCYGKV